MITPWAYILERLESVEVNGELTPITDATTGARTIYAFGDGALHKIAVVPRTKWKSVSGQHSALVSLCEKSMDWESASSACQSLVDTAPSVPPGDITAQVFDPLKLLRDGNPL